MLLAPTRPEDQGSFRAIWTGKNMLGREARSSVFGFTSDLPPKLETAGILTGGEGNRRNFIKQAAGLDWQVLLAQAPAEKEPVTATGTVATPAPPTDGGSDAPLPSSDLPARRAQASALLHPPVVVVVVSPRPEAALVSPAPLLRRRRDRQRQRRRHRSSDHQTRRWRRHRFRRQPGEPAKPAAGAGPGPGTNRRERRRPRRFHPRHSGTRLPSPGRRRVAGPVAGLQTPKEEGPQLRPIDRRSAGGYFLPTTFRYTIRTS